MYITHTYTLFFFYKIWLVEELNQSTPKPIDFIDYLTIFVLRFLPSTNAELHCVKFKSTDSRIMKAPKAKLESLDSNILKMNLKKKLIIFPDT